MTKYEAMIKKEKERKMDSIIGWSIVGVSLVIVLVVSGIAAMKGAWF
nr:MAG TPA: hypothetical protein [Caudoviricetes sp.]